MNSVSDLPLSLSCMNGKLKPAKLEPPPMQPMTMSGLVSMSSNCFIASMPYDGLVHATWFNTEPKVYLACSSVRQSSTASLMATPREPLWLGSCLRSFLPNSVLLLGEANISAP